MESVGKTIIKWFSIFLIAVIVAALTLVALGKITWRLFWIIVIVEAIFAYYVLPKLRKEL